MVRRIRLLLFIGLAWGQLIDELEILHIDKDRFLFQHENLYKSEGIWYSDVNNEPVTRRLEIYSKNLDEYKIAECSLVNGLKNGTNCVILFRVNGHNPLKLDVHSSHINFPLGTINRSTSRSMQILQINASATRCE